MSEEDGLWLGQIDGARVLVQRDVLDTIRTAILSTGSLFEFARTQPTSRRLQGRRELYVFELESSPPLIVRRLHHGGLMAPVTGDRFLRTGAYRPFNEMRVSRHLASVGIATAEVIAACVYPGGIWYRGEIVRRYIDEAADLSWRLREDLDQGRAVAPVMAAVGRLIGRLHSAGVIHPDLNMRNVLIMSRARPEALIIDLEKCRLRVALSRAQRMRMLARLRRSVRRFEEANNVHLPGEAWHAFEEAYAA